MRGRRRMDEEATPPPSARPSLSRSHTGASSDNDAAGDISLEVDMQDISLNGDEEDREEVLQDVTLGSPSPSSTFRVVPLSPSPRKPVHHSALGLGMGMDMESEGGDITSAISPPTSPARAPASPGLRSLTPSPGSSRSRSPAQVPLPPGSPVGSLSPHLPLPQSPHTPRSTSSRSNQLTSPLSGSSRRTDSRSRSRSPSPAPDQLFRKPSIPVSMPLHIESEDSNAVGENDGAPFESIPLSSTPPKPTVSVPLPSSPRGDLGAPTGKEGKRRSWNGFGVTKEDKAKKRMSWMNGAPAAGSSLHVQDQNITRSAPMTRNGISKEDIEEEDVGAETDPEQNGGEGSVPKPRLHAPPAHPHPFPLPSATSPTITSNKRLSAHSNLPAPTPSVAGPSGGIGAKGISTFDKIVNHTRPSHLPPKSKDEDDTHYHQWEQMMAQAREHEKERRKLQDQRRAEKEKRLAAATPQWDALLSDAGFTVGKVKGDKALREMWFHGVPGYLRGKAWGLAIGNPLAMSKDSYKSYLSRARKALDSGRFPGAILHAMEADMDRTLPQLKLFGRNSPMRADLQEFICAWVVYRSDDGLGYAPYVSHIAAMLLLPSPPAQAFLQLCNLLARPCLHAFVTETKDEIDAFYRVFENLQADTFPKIYANCKNLGLKLPESYFRSILLEQVPFEACCRLWDQIVLDGDGYIFRSALAIFGFLEPRLHYPDKQEILSVLEGRNKATLAITERERERARLKGEAFDEELDGKLSVFGLNEDALFDWLASDGWRESRYERLVVREMPD